MAFILLALCAATSCILISSAVWTIYSLWFHPLSRFPGPRFWAISRIPYAAALGRGCLHMRIKELHEKYGPVVRIAPDELSFIQDAAWQDIYTGQNGNKGFPKHKAYSNAQGFQSLFDAPDDTHTRLRKLLMNKFFSQAAVNKQEEILHQYTDILIRRLKEQAVEPSKSDSKDGHNSATINLQEWYNFATFDIAGNLTVSEDFGCLEGLTYHPWVLMVLTHFKMSAFVMILRIYTPLDHFLIYCAPPRLHRLKDKFLRLVREKIDRRLANSDPEEPDSRDDFVSAAMIKNQKTGGLSMNRDELEANCILMILAGSETMATSLLSATNFLCKNPRVLQNLVEEIRGFDKEADLNIANLSHLPYLNAVIRETHRICPPLANGPSRVVGPYDAQIAGHIVPAGTAVAVTQYAAYHSPTNFYLPEEFVPERWLKDTYALASSPYANDKREDFYPFSLGARDCLGRNIAMAEFRIVLARMLWNFDLEAVSEARWEEQKCFMLWQKEKYLVRLKIARDV